MKWIQRFFYVGMMLIGFVIAGATSILTQDVGFQAMTEPWFYLNQIITDIAIIFIIYGVMYACVDKFTETNEEFIHADRNINDFAISKEYVPTIFGRFLEALNDRRKVAQYEYDMKKRLSRLDNARMFPKIWKRKYGESDFFIWWHGTEEDKDANEYCTKRKELEIKLSDEYIDENIKWIMVKYDKITTDIVLTGTYHWSKSKGPNDFVEKHPNSKLAIHKLPSFFFAFGFSFLAASMIFGAVNFSWSALVSFCAKIISLLWNTLVTIRYAKTYCKDTILKDTLFRSGIIIEYRKWLSEKSAAVFAEDRKAIADKAKALPEGATR